MTTSGTLHGARPAQNGAPSGAAVSPGTALRGPIEAERGLFDYRPFWAKRFGVAPFLPRTRAEMDVLGWEACDVIVVTGDAYIDHPSFGMALVGRLLEAHGFRVGILDQPDWHSREPFRELGAPTLYFGVTGGNMDSLVNHYTSDKKPRRDDAYTPGGVSGARPDRATIVYTQRCREAFPDVPVVIGGIEASLRRLAHYDYWSGKVRRSLLVDSGADILLYGNAERALVEVTHRIARGEHPRDLLDIRGTVVRRACGATGPVDAPGAFVVERSDRIDPVGVIDPIPDPYATEEEMRARGQTADDAENGGQTFGGETSPAADDAENGGQTFGGETSPAADAAGQTFGGEAAVDGGRAQAAKRSAPPKNPSLVQLRKKQKELPRSNTVLRLPSWHEVKEDRALYAHTSRVFHLEANPHNARSLVQRNGDTDVWQNPPPIPLTTAEMDGVYDLPYQKVPHPAHQSQKIPAYEMIRFSVTIMRGCFGGCSFCSITEHEGRIIQSRSEKSILREVESLKQLPGFTGAVSDLGGPTANMYRIACKSRAIEAACRKPSCVYPGVCPNLNTSHEALIQLYRKARAIPGIKKISIASGLRYDLAVEDPEYIKELVTHHVGGYLKIAPEHVAEGPLSKMMKPGMGAYNRFKELFERYSKAAGKKQYLIPYFIAAHPGTTDEDMLELALWLKKNGFKADQVQAFLPGPMSYSAAMYHTGKNPLRPVKRDSEEVFSAKTHEQRQLHKAFLRYHDEKNWPLLDTALRRMGRTDLIGHGSGKLIPNGYREKPGLRADRQHANGARGGGTRGEHSVRGGARPAGSGARPTGPHRQAPRTDKPGTTFVTQRTGMAQFDAARPPGSRPGGKRRK